MEAGQRNIEGFFAGADHDQSANTTLGDKASKSSKLGIKRSRSSTPLTTNSDDDIELLDVDEYESARRVKEEVVYDRDVELSAVADIKENGSGRDERQWRCDKCERIFAPPLRDLSDDEWEQVREVQRMEHDDWHFALALSKAEDGGVGGGGRGGSGSRSGSRGGVGRGGGDDDVKPIVRGADERMKRSGTSQRRQGQGDGKAIVKKVKKEVGIQAFFSPTPKPKV